jgi:hypothetical protein
MSFRGLIYSSRTEPKRLKVPGRSRRVARLKGALLSLQSNLSNFIHGLRLDPRAEMFMETHLSVPIIITLNIQTIIL